MNRSTIFRNTLFLILGLILLLIITFFVIFGRKNDTENPLSSKNSLENAGNGQLASAIAAGLTTKMNNTDTDGDGLKDWEETLWSTSISNPDSDGDGTSDGDETKNGRNPAKKGADSINVEEILKETEGGAKEIEKLNPTQRFARDFFTKYLILKQGGAEIDPETQGILIDNLLKDQTLDLNPVDYGVTQVKIAPTNTQDSIRSYGNALGRAIRLYSPNTTENELTILAKYLETEDPRALIALDSIIASYKNVIKQALETSVPASAVTFHVQYLNSLSYLQKVAEAIRNAENDPLTAFQAMAQYEARATDVLTAVEQLSLYFIQKNIIFQQADDGYAFTHSI